MPPTAIYEIDCRTLQFKNVNDYMCKLIGYSEQELLSMKSIDLLSEESKQRFQEIMLKSMAGEKIDENVEFEILTKNRGRVWATISATLTYKNNELYSAFVVANDITERRKAAAELLESRNNFKEMFEKASDGVLIANSKTKNFIFANPRICEITGYSYEELLKMGVNDIHPEIDLLYVINQINDQPRRKNYSRNAYSYFEKKWKNSVL